MPYKLSDFESLEVARDKSGEPDDVVIQGGRNICDLLSERARRMLNEPGGPLYRGDRSSQDSAVITSILSSGYSSADAFTTFIRSPRGKDAEARKAGHFQDYVLRTIRGAVGFLHASKPNGNGNGTSHEEPAPPTDHYDVDFSKKRKTKKGEGVLISMGTEIETEKAQWLWPGYIPLGKITIIAGDPGMGKSTIALDLVSRISRGTFLPTLGRTVSGTCLIASAEDSAEDTIIPRLIACEANLKRVGIIREVRIEDELRFLSIPRDLNRLRDVIVKKGARILIIDPLNAFLEKGTDTYKDQDIRSVLAPLESMAEETGVSILIIAHLNKKEDANTLYRVGGSIGFIGAARSVLAVSNTPNGTRVLFSLKSNLAKTPPALGYEVRQVRRTRKADEWLGEEIINSSAIRWHGEVDFDSSKTKVTEQTKIDEEVESFLRQILLDSQVPTEDIYSEARQAGISRTHLSHVKTSLGIRSVKTRDGRWNWKWPDSEL